MAQSRKKQKNFTPPQDSLSLEGLENLLENGSVEIVADLELESNPVLDMSPVQEEILDFSPTPVVNVGAPVTETRLILDLMSQVEIVNEMMLETSYALTKTRARMHELESQIIGEDLLVSQIKELETWLDALKAENANLKRPWWKKLFGMTA